MLHVPVSVITEQLRNQSIHDDHVFQLPEEDTFPVEGDSCGVVSCLSGGRWTSSLAEPRDFFARSSLQSHSRPIDIEIEAQHNDTFSLSSAADDALMTSGIPPKKKQCRLFLVPGDCNQTIVPATSSSLTEAEALTDWRHVSLPGFISNSGFNPNTAQRITPSFTFEYPDGDNQGRKIVKRSTDASRSRGHDDVMAVSGIRNRSALCETIFQQNRKKTCLSVECSSEPVFSTDASSGLEMVSDFYSASCSPIPRPSSASSLGFAQRCQFPVLPRCSSHETPVAHSSFYKEYFSYEHPTCTVGASSEAATSHTIAHVCFVPTKAIGERLRRSSVARCHSQPCILHDRRYAMKRRRDDRPMLDFRKMTETAYCSRTAARIITSPGEEKQQCRDSLGKKPVCGLMAISSSPRDSDIPSAHLPVYPKSLPADCNVVLEDSHETSFSPHCSGISSDMDVLEPVKMIGDDREEDDEELEDVSEGGNCQCNRDADRSEAVCDDLPLFDLDIDQIEND